MAKGKDAKKQPQSKNKQEQMADTLNAQSKAMQGEKRGQNSQNQNNQNNKNQFK
ncbi:MAG: hypothetical protein FWD34_07255 [Oscillospiraceae bacterium]|nr:hypothetical protein [Oscillospiraceae bacterium]